MRSEIGSKVIICYVVCKKKSGLFRFDLIVVVKIKKKEYKKKVGQTEALAGLDAVDFRHQIVSMLDWSFS